MLVTSLSFGSTFSFLAVKLEDLGTGPLLIGLTFSMESFASAALQPFTGRLADRVNRRVLVVVGIAFTALMLALVGAAHHVVPVMALLVGMGIGQSFSFVASSAMQVVAGRRVGMGTVIGLGSAGNGAGILAGALLAGLIVDLYSLDAAFYFGGAAMVVGLPLFWWLTAGEQITEEVGPLPPRRADGSRPADARAAEAQGSGPAGAG
jgi:MFS family permease